MSDAIERISTSCFIAITPLKVFRYFFIDFDFGLAMITTNLNRTWREFYFYFNDLWLESCDSSMNDDLNEGSFNRVNESWNIVTRTIELYFAYFARFLVITLLFKWNDSIIERFFRNWESYELCSLFKWFFIVSLEN